jgi:uncharacterized protein (TIGR02646 family)
MIKLNRPECPDPVGLRTNYKVPENKATIKEASSGKCMYCESNVDHVYFGDIEHIKPKATYPEDEFNWHNLGFVCAVCNNKKSNKYSIDPEFINPYEDEPEDFFISRDCVISPKRGSDRGELTILEIGLNRPELMERRKEKLDDIERFIRVAFSHNSEILRDRAITELKKEGRADKEYSFFIKSLISQNQI